MGRAIWWARAGRARLHKLLEDNKRSSARGRRRPPPWRHAR